MKKNDEVNIFSKSYVAEAEKCIRLLKVKDEPETKDFKEIDFKCDKYNFKITTTQIRKLLSILNEIYSFVIIGMASSANGQDPKEKEEVEKKCTILKEKMQYFKMRCIYESGRDDYGDIKKTTGVHDFIYRTKLIKYLDEFDKIGELEKLREAFIWIFHYMESLVAYHRFLGGKDSER